MSDLHLRLWITLLFSLAMATHGHSQSVNFEDGFEDGDFTSNPPWTGDDTLYTITEEGENHLLQLDGNDDDDPAYLSVPSTAVYGSWEFFFKYNGATDPSGSNKATVFLMSDQKDLTNNVNGYAVRVGESGDDYFTIVRYDNGEEAETILPDTTVIESNETGYRVKVTRNVGGYWQIAVGEGYDGTLHNTDSTGIDNTYTSSEYFGVLTEYTSTRSDKFFYDDFTIIEFPVALSKLNVESNQEIEVLFTKDVEPSSVSTTDFSINNGIGSPSNILVQNNTVALFFTEPLPGDDYVLSVTDIDDQSGNTIDPNSTLSFSLFDPFEPGDVIINEFMYDPPAGQAEYVEIKNRSDKVLNLQDWRIGDDTNTALLSADTLALSPNDFLVLSSDTATLSAIYGDQRYTETYLPALNNTGDAIRLITAADEMADSLTYASDWGGNGVALERRSGSTPGIYRANWGDHPADSLTDSAGSPGEPNQVPADETPPLLTDLTIRSDEILELGFDERLDPTTASTASNYQLSNGTISSATVTAPDSVILELGGPLQNAQSYMLSISGVEDIFTNAITSADTTFTYYEISAADSGDIAINEFMYDPPSGQSEYVELYNHSDKSLDLRDWTLSDNRARPVDITNSSFILPPDSYVVLAPDDHLLSDYPGLPLITMDDFPALNNGGDHIVIHAPNNTLLDSLAYTSGWGGEKVSLERRSVDFSATYQSNWGNTPDTSGTPGSANAIEPDTQPPALTSFSIQSSDRLMLQFSEELNPSAAKETANYQLVDGPAVARATFAAPDSIFLALGQDLQNATQYTLIAENIADIFGNAASSADTSFTFYQVSPVDSGDVFINEFSMDPESGRTEYVEIYNPTARSFNLQHWTLSDNRGRRAPITGDRHILPPDSFVVIAPDNTLLSHFPDMALIAMDSFPALNNSGDDIVIHSANGLRLDSLRYDSNWESHPTLERRTISVPGFYPENWGPSPTIAGGTPGAANQVAADEHPPVLTELNIRTDNHLELAFNERIDSASVTVKNLTISDNAIRTVTAPAADTVNILLDAPLQNAREYQVTLSGLQDLFGNAISQSDTTFTYYEVSPAEPGEVFINEFMYDPPSGSAEFVELYNPTDRSFDLHGWTINDNTGSRQTITNASFVIPPDSFLVITEEHPENPDIAVLSMGSRFPTLNNNEDQIVIRDSSGVLLDSLRYSDSWGGSGTSLERQTTSIPSSIEENWGHAPDSLGSPGYHNRRAPDTTPPELESLHIRDSQQILLLFSERLKAGPAAAPENYALSGGPAISTIEFFAPDSVLISTEETLPNATELSLTIQNIPDIFGNNSSPYDTTFTHYTISEADSGDIFITEFNYNPASGETEYIEIHNSTNRSFDLSNWTLSDNRGIATSIASEERLLPPESYAVLAPDNTLLENHPDIRLVSLGSSFPALNNSGDNIVLKNNQEVVLDSLQYSSGWGGDERALERKTTKVAGTFKENWGPASQDGGSPGVANTIPKDTQPPELQELYPVDESKLQLVFSESITAASATDFSNYQLTPARDIQLVSAQGDSVTLFLSDPLVSGEAYEVNIANITDIFGNRSEPTNREIEYLRIDGARSGDIVINEIMAVPGNGEAEFVELYNRSDKNIDLTNWTLGDASAEATFGRNIQLRAHRYLTLTGSSSLAQMQENAIRVSGFPNLNNAGDLLFIRDSAGATIDSLHYRASWATDIEGRSLERKDPFAASNDPSNWQSTNADDGATAGTQNSRFEEDTSAPRITFAKIRADGRIQVQFNEFIRLTKDLQFTMDGQPLSVSAFDSTNGNRIILQEMEAKARQSGTMISAANVTDMRGNVSPASEIPVAHPLKPGDLVINEIMFNPLDDADDNKPDQSEYVELYNTRDYALSLEGVVLHDAPDEDGNVRDLHPVSTTAQWVQAGETVLIYADQAQPFEESTVARFFDLQSPAMQEILRVDRASLSLASDDALYLADSTGAAIDSVYYSETWHNPNLIDTRGIALERITPEGPGNESSNWGSSVHSKGGTPKAQNSIYQDEPEAPQETGISFTPNPFSPDGDGYEDNLLISYKLDQPDYLLRINIFDRYGRHIKELADGKPAGFEGSLLWDGRRDDGRRNRIGIYIIVFEVYDSASGSDKAYKKPVVIARKLN